jgi:hypothetical protein
MVNFEVVKVMEGEGGGRKEGEEGEREEKKMERYEKENIGVEKGKWGNRWLSEFILGQDGEGS